MTYQLTAPLLDACVLGVVENEDVYGYTLTQKVMDVVDISESTLYPVLRRLQKNGLLITYDQPYQGRNRRYYKITAEGNNQLFFFRREWEEYKKKINALIGPGSSTGTNAYSLSEETVSGTVDGNPVSLTLYNTEHDQQKETVDETISDTEGGTQ